MPGPPDPVPLAYSVEAPNGHRAFLLGSLHVGRPGGELHPVVRDAFRKAPLLVLELDLSAVDPRELRELELELGRLPEGDSLESHLSAETWQLLRERCERGGCDIDELRSLEPWLVAIRLLGEELSSTGLETRHGVEQRLLESRDTQEIVGLESPRDQLALFDELPARQQELMLRDALLPSGTDAEALVGAWRRGDALALEALVFGQLEQSPELLPFYEATFFARNLRFAQGIAELLVEAPSAFVVLGAGHLVGPRGVPTLLVASGHRVSRVAADPASAP